MDKKLLITLPCSIRELKAKLDNFDGCDVVVCNYDGNGDSLYVIQTDDEKKPIEKETKGIINCKHRISIYCKSPLAAEYAKTQMQSGGCPFVCPFNNGEDCKGYEPKKQDPVERLQKFVRDLEAAHKASANSKLVFK